MCMQHICRYSVSCQLSSYKRYIYANFRSDWPRKLVFGLEASSSTALYGRLSSRKWSCSIDERRPIFVGHIHWPIIVNAYLTPSLYINLYARLSSHAVYMYVALLYSVYAHISMQIFTQLILWAFILCASIRNFFGSSEWKIASKKFH